MFSQTVFSMTVPSTTSRHARAPRAPRRLRGAALVVAAACLFALPGCGDEETTGGSAGATGGKSSSAKSSSSGDYTPPTVPALGTQQIPAEVAALLPAQSHVIVFISSIDDAAETLGRVPADPGEEFDAQSFFEDSLYATQLYEAGAIANDRPFALGLQLAMGPMGPEPRQVLVIPVKDTAAAESISAGSGSKQIADGYVVCSEQSILPPLGYSGTTLPLSSIAVHIDLATVIAQMRPMVERMLQMFPMMAAQGSPGTDPQALQKALQPMIGALTAFFDSAKTYQFGLERAGTGLAIHGHLQLNEGSRMAGWFSGASRDPWSYAGSLDEKAPMALLMVGDFAGLSERMGTTLTALMQLSPTSSGPDYSEYMNRAFALSKYLGDIAAFNLRLDERKHMVMEMAYEVEDGARVLAEYNELFNDQLLEESGIGIQKLDRTKIGGIEFDQYGMEVDYEKIAAMDPNVDPAMMKATMESVYPPGTRMLTGVDGTRLYFAMGSEGSVAPLVDRTGRSPAELPSDLQHAISRIADDSLGLAGQVDMTRFMVLTAGLAASAAGGGDPSATRALESVGATPVLGYFGADGAEWRHGVTISGESLRKLPQLFEKVSSMAPMPGGTGRGF